MVRSRKLKSWAALGSLVIVAIVVLLARMISFPSFFFQTTRLNQEFHESIMRVIPNEGDILEVALLESDETLSRSDSKRVFDDIFDLGTTVSEIRVKVTYRYHIKLSDEWHLQPDHGVLNVVAPQIRPSLPPAIDTSTMEKRSEAGWFRFNEAENLDLLEKSLSPTLARMSLTPAKLVLVKDAARKSVEKFVRRWITSRDKSPAVSFDKIIVTFPEEGEVRARP